MGVVVHRFLRVGFPPGKPRLWYGYAVSRSFSVTSLWEAAHARRRSSPTPSFAPRLAPSRLLGQLLNKVRRFLKNATPFPGNQPSLAAVKAAA